MKTATEQAPRIREFIRKRIEAKGKLPAGCDLEAYDYRESGAIDSLAIIKFLMELEAEFDIVIRDEEMLAPGFTTVGGLTALVVDKLR